MAINSKYVQAQTFQLAGTGVSIGDSSMTLENFNQIDGTPLTMSDFGTQGFGTVEPGSGINEEQISWTGVVINGDGTSTLTGIKTVLNVYPYTQTSNFTSDHSGAVDFVISNTAGFYNQFANVNNDETITANWSFPSPTLPDQVATMQYVDDIAIAGAVSATPAIPGIQMVATQNDIVNQIDSRLYNSESYFLTLLPSDIRNTSVRSFLAAQNIAQNIPVYIKSYNPANTPTLDNNIISSSSSYSFNIGTNPNQILLVAVAVRGNTGTTGISGVTCGGIGMISVGLSKYVNTSFSVDLVVQIFKLINPPQGVNTIIITPSGGGTVLNGSVAYSYYNVDQTVGVDVVTTTTSDTGSLSTTTLENNSVVFGASAIYGVFGGTGDGSASFNSSPADNLTYLVSEFVAGDSGVISSAGSVAGSYTWAYTGVGPTAGQTTIQCALKPLGTSTFGMDIASSVDTAHSTTFIGFTEAAVVTNALGPVTTTGYVDGFTGLVPGVYYLQDTAGTIGTSPGTVTKIVGISVSSTTLLLVVNG